MGWPYFTEHLVMATADNGLATMLYAANETTAMVADSVSLRMEEVTHYPFDETITLILHPERDVEFPLYLRIPAWAKGAEVNEEFSSTGKCNIEEATFFFNTLFIMVRQWFIHNNPVA